MRHRLALYATLLREATEGLLARPGRSALTGLGTLLGIAALVATLGISNTAGNRIVSRFDTAAATTVIIAPRDDTTGAPLVTLPSDVEARLAGLNGLVVSGVKAPLSNVPATSTIQLLDPLGLTARDIPVIGATPGLFDAVGAHVDIGRTFDLIHDERADAVAVLGPAAARRLEISQVDSLPSIFVGSQQLLVIGILDDGLEISPDLLNAIIVPMSLADARLSSIGGKTVYLRTELGAANQIAAEAPIALHPNDPSLLAVDAPAEAVRVRSEVAADVDVLFLLLAGLSLVVGIVSIANVTLISVLERQGEVGLRRAIGARRSDIAVQFLTESMFLGLLASIVGTSIGMLVVVSVAAANEWSPVMQTWLPFTSPAVGALSGLAGGAYPAWKTTRIEPSQALRAGV